MPQPTYKQGTGYWTDGVVDPKTNIVGTGQWVPTPPTVTTPPPSANNTMTSVGFTAPGQTQNDIDMNNALAARTAAASDTGLPSANERQYATQMFQAQIDALNKVYAEQKAASVVAGRGRLGSQNAIQARRGLLGSDFGEAATVGQEQANTAELNAIDAELNAKVEAVRGKISEAALEMAKNRREAATKTADVKLDEIKYRKETANSKIKSQVAAAFASGLNKDTMMSQVDSWVTEFAKSGISVDKNDIINLINEGQKDLTSAAAAKAKATLETQKTVADITKPYESGGYIYQFDTNSGSWKNTGTKLTDVKNVQPLNILDVQRYNELYPGAGVTAGDSELTANSKINKMQNTPTKTVRDLVIEAKNEGSTYESVIAEIDKNVDTTPEAKDTAKKIAEEVYRPPVTSMGGTELWSASSVKTRKPTMGEEMHINGIYNTLFGK